MIVSYHRPKTLEAALELLALPSAVVLGGGTYINTPAFDKTPLITVVDLQDLALAEITVAGETMEIGACATLQQLLEYAETPAALLSALRQEAPVNVRNRATVAGSLVTADGRSPFATTLLALDAQLTLVEQGLRQSMSLGDFLALRGRPLAHRVITEIRMPLNVRVAWESVSRTPRDKPIVGVSLAMWPAGRLRMALGGVGSAPMLGFDAADRNGLEACARSAFHEGSDESASAEYRMDAAATLAERCLDRLAREPRD
jgi:CO/xanthine dehydrogenase FAD-binding subunit